MRYKWVYWCTTHQQYVSPEARTKSRKLRRCKILRLNLTQLRQIDLEAFTAWLRSNHSSVYHAQQPKASLRLARKMRWIGA
jgi:hypothetical protein